MQKLLIRHYAWQKVIMRPDCPKYNIATWLEAEVYEEAQGLGMQDIHVHATVTYDNSNMPHMVKVTAQGN